MLRIDDRGPVRWLILDRPEKLNAIPENGWERLAAEFRDFEASEQRVLVITGDHDEFCSGAELGGDQARIGPAERYARMKIVDDAALTLHRTSKPTVAAVDGVAAGAGMNLALGCDIVIGSDRCRFSEIFVRRGLTVDFGGTWHLPRVVGLQRAKELAFTGRMVHAEEARRIGLVLDIVPQAELVDRVTRLTEELAAQSPLGQMFAKRALNASFGSSLEESLAFEAQAQAVCLSSEDALEGVTAFLQKREPEFRGR